MRKLLLPLVVLFLAACGENRFFQSQEFQVVVDSVQVPEAIAGGQPFNVVFYGGIGNSDCFSFSRFVTEQDATRLAVAAVGLYQTTGVCNPAEVLLDGETLEVAPPFDDPFRVVVYQPEGDSLVHVIQVQ